MKILVACESSGVVRDAFRSLGHDAISCDLRPSERPGPHIQQDVREALRESWDMVVAFPPCTFLSAARLPHKNKDPLWDEHTREGSRLFLDCLDANAPLVAVENPKMHALASSLCGPPSCFVEPWEHGHPYTKKTLLWLRALPPLFASDIVVPTGPWVDSSIRSPGKTRNPTDRGRTFPGIAFAMAAQWGGQ